MERIGLMHLKEIFIPQEFINSIYEEFKAMGKKGFERLALFAGEKKGEQLYVTHLLFPKQQLIKSAHGVSFHVEAEELERIGEWLFENKRSLIAQIHSHPQEAYHSEADDALAIITTFGGVSIVIPDFGNSDLNFEKSAIYRLRPESGWTKLTKVETEHLIKIIE